MRLPRRMTPGALQRRLLLLLLAPLLLLALLNTWFDYQLADSAAIQQDRELLTLVPQLADAVRAPRGMGGVQLALPPELADFLATRPGAFAILNAEGLLLAGTEWLRDYPPDTREPEFSSQEQHGVVYRVVSQRITTPAGELTVRLADGAGMAWQRFKRLWLKVLMPNVSLALLAYGAVQWAVRRALRPLRELGRNVSGRSPRDLPVLDVAGSPQEVQPLVRALNDLFALVNTQAESQQRFVADAAHQLRTPLAGLQAQVEALAHNAPPDLAEPILRMRDACRRTATLVQQLLTLSRLDTCGLPARARQCVGLKPLCEQVLEAHLAAATRRDLDLGLDVQAVYADGDEWLLRELLHNLVDNALKYTPAGGSVTLRCHAVADTQPAKVCLTVEDDGPGVAPAERARIVQRFYRIAGSASEGSGLGLAIADEIARAHQSRLQIDSGSHGRGLSVSLVLSAVRE